ncbi:MAG: hypothetical protein KatS3mg123_2054 [Burkholderiales bacterium]|nr:MAG: hypothetical protein KatS3mg123_2054 [Burkholderiales bacterium]
MGWIGGEIEHVEAHGRDVGQPRLHVPEGAVAARLGAGGAGEQLVPGGKAGPYPVHHHFQLPAVVGGQAPVGIAHRQPCQALVQADAAGFPGFPGLRQALGPLPQRLGLRGPCPLGRLLDQPGAYPGGHQEVLRLGAAGEIVPPGQEGVHPGGHGVAVAAQALHRKAPAPAVVAQGLHRPLMPLVFRLVAVAQHAGQHVVAVGEGVGLHHHPLADHPLDGEAAAVHLRAHALDHRPHAPVPGRGGLARGQGLRSVHLFIPRG